MKTTITKGLIALSLILAANVVSSKANAGVLLGTTGGAGISLLLIANKPKIVEVIASDDVQAFRYDGTVSAALKEVVSRIAEKNQTSADDILNQLKDSPQE